ncbi:hypothetical protein ACET7H_01180 [Aeromonas veronii]|uniref:hypothetical protein n=1 Tax=Aeromonas veronii TaxID=654 RepID=UPI0038F53B09
MQFARHLQGALGEQSRVISVAVAYSRATPERWEHQPDHIARDVEDLLHRRAISVTPVADCHTEHAKRRSVDRRFVYGKPDGFTLSWLNTLSV